MKFRDLILLLFLLPVPISAIGASSAELLIVTTDYLFEPAERLAAIHRSRLSMEVEVVALPDDASSEDVRRLVKGFYEASGDALKYLILYGTGWNDGGGDAYHGMISVKFSPSMAPFTAPALSVGRIPVATLEQADAYNVKVENYLNSVSAMSHSREIILSADDGDNLSHQQDAEAAALSLAKCQEALIHKIYVGEYSVVNGKVPGARRHLAEAFERGAGLVVYVGHGDKYSITGEGLMNSHGAASLANGALPWGFFCSCLIGSFGGDRTSFSEALLFNPHGGVIGCVTTRQEVYASYNRAILLAFSKRWAAVGSGVTFGDLWFEAQRECFLTAASQADEALGQNVLSFNFLGDPALPVKFDAGSIQCDFREDTHCIAGDVGGCTDGAEVNVAIYSTIERGSVVHSDVKVGECMGKIDGGKFNIPVRMKAGDMQSRYVAYVSVVDSDAYRAWTGKVEFDCLPSTQADSAHPPVIVSVAERGGVIEVRALADDSGLNLNRSDIGGYSRCVIDGSVITPLEVAADDGSGYTFLTAKGAALPQGVHSVHVVVEGNSGKRAVEDFSFRSGDCASIKLMADAPIARETVILTWDSSVDVAIPLILKITDIDGDVVRSAEIAGESAYSWNLEDNASRRVKPGIYYCHLVSSEPGIARSEKIRLAVLPR